MSAARRAASLVTSKWLSSSLESVKVFDATWFFPTLGKSALEAYRAQHVPGARFLDIDAIDDTGKDWPHMLPTPAGFESAMRGAGVNAEDHVVVYDATAIMCAAPRMYWSLRAMGHDQVSVLDGGLGAWIAAGFPMESGDPPPATPGNFVARPNESLLASREQVLEIVEASIRGRNHSEGEQPAIVDARSVGRVTAEGEDEPWRFRYPHVRRGRIPGSRNVPHASILNTDGTFKEAAELRRIFAEAGVRTGSGDRRVITTCGSGVTAAVLSLGLELCGSSNVALYDGSWCEWGNHMDLPVESGPLKKVVAE